MPITATFRRLWQKDAEFKARMGYIARHCCKRKQGRLEKMDKGFEHIFLQRYKNGQQAREKMVSSY